MPHTFNGHQNQSKPDWKFCLCFEFPLSGIVLSLTLVCNMGISMPFSLSLQINHFLKEGFVKAKKGGSGYLKVKVEDGDYIELPCDANRQYVYWTENAVSCALCTSNHWWY